MMKYPNIGLITFMFAVSVKAEAVILSYDANCVSWQRESTGCLHSLNSVAVDLASGRAIAAGDRGTILLRDVTGTWEDVSPEGVGADFNSVAIGVNGVCLACGDGGTLLSSFDRGESWRIVEEFDYPSTDLLWVNFDPTHPSEFLITGENGFVFSTDEGGVVHMGTSDPIVSSSVKLCSGFPEFAVSSSGRIISLSGSSVPELDRSVVINGGTNLVSGGTPFVLVGEQGLILSLNDDHWETASSSVDADLNSVAAVEFGSVLCAVGDGGVIVVSRDNGLTWERVSSGTSRNLNCVAADGAGRVIIVGDSVFPGVLFP